MPIFEITFGHSAPPPSVWETIITGLTVAIIGGAVIFGLNVWRETHTAYTHRKREAGVLAFTIAAQIDQFINKCYEVVARGYDFDHDGQVTDRSGSAGISFSDALKWEVFDKNLQHRIRSLPNEVDVAGAVLDKIWDEGEGDMLEVVQEREELFAELGLKALEINNILHALYGVPLLDRKTIDPGKIFRASLKSFADARDRYGPSKEDLADLPDLLSPPSIEELNKRRAALSEDLRSARTRHGILL
jgi:hypothetical protein